MWEKGIELTKELVHLYEEELYDYERLSVILVGASSFLPWRIFSHNISYKSVPVFKIFFLLVTCRIININFHYIYVGF